MDTRELVSMETRQGMIIERRIREVDAPAQDLHRVVTGIGGARVAGTSQRGPGDSAGLSIDCSAVWVSAGDDVTRTTSASAIALDFWRVEALEDGRMLRLRAEMKLPGRAWLQYEFHETGENRTPLVQTAVFIPKGLAGLVYWYALYPIHGWIFRGLIRACARRGGTIGDSAWQRVVRRLGRVGIPRRSTTTVCTVRRVSRASRWAAL